MSGLCGDVPIFAVPGLPMMATLVKVGHALRVSLALHGPTLFQLSHEIDQLLAWPPIALYYYEERHIRNAILMAV